MFNSPPYYDEENPLIQRERRNYFFATSFRKPLLALILPVLFFASFWFWGQAVFYANIKNSTYDMRSRAIGKSNPQIISQKQQDEPTSKTIVNFIDSNGWNATAYKYYLRHDKKMMYFIAIESKDPQLDGVVHYYAVQKLQVKDKFKVHSIVVTMNGWRAFGLYADKMKEAEIEALNKTFEKTYLYFRTHKMLLTNSDSIYLKQPYVNNDAWDQVTFYFDDNTRASQDYNCIVYTASVPVNKGLNTIAGSIDDLRLLTGIATIGSNGGYAIKFNRKAKAGLLLSDYLYRLASVILWFVFVIIFPISVEGLYQERLRSYSSSDLKLSFTKEQIAESLVEALFVRWAAYLFTGLLLPAIAFAVIALDSGLLGGIGKLRGLLYYAQPDEMGRMARIIQYITLFTSLLIWPLAGMVVVFYTTRLREALLHKRIIGIAVLAVFILLIYALLISIIGAFGASFFAGSTLCLGFLLLTSIVFIYESLPKKLSGVVNDFYEEHEQEDLVI